MAKNKPITDLGNIQQVKSPANVSGFFVLVILDHPLKIYRFGKMIYIASINQPGS